MNVTLDFIAGQVRDCILCPLHKNRTHAVPGEGPLSARIMFVGESPGDEEDIQGRPFRGRAGNVLNEALHAARIDRDEVFITNVVKCHPPQNRLPHQQEIQTCVSHYLFTQMELINPVVVCLLGNTAANALLGNIEPARVRGKVIERNRMYFVTYHPAAAGRSSTLKTVFFADIKRLAEYG